MPVVFRPADVLELNKYGIFTKWRLPGVEIPASAAVSITAAQTNTWRDPFQGEDPYYDLEFPIRQWRGIDKWGMLIERFNWGKTSRPDKVYYEIWNYGKLIMPQEQESFHCCGVIGTSDEDNRSTHPAAAEKLKLKLWNCSDPPEDVYIEFTMWYYVFPLEHLDEVMAMSYESFFGMLHDDLNAILSELRKEEPPKGFPIPPPHFPAKRR